MTDDNIKQFAIVIDSAAHNGYPAAVDYVDVRNPRLIGHTSVINPPAAHYTYSMLEMREAVAAPIEVGIPTALMRC
jgi:hypothetical protein